MNNYKNSVADNRWKVTSSNGVEQYNCSTITEFSDFIVRCVSSLKLFFG